MDSRRGVEHHANRHPCFPGCIPRSRGAYGRGPAGYRLGIGLRERPGADPDRALQWLQLWLDGTAVQFSTSTGLTSVVGGQNLGTVPMGNFQLGDDSTSRTYTWYADDLIVSTVQPGF